MTKIIYNISPARGKWYVRLNDKICCEFKDKNQAIMAALTAMKDNIEKGHDAHAYIQDKDCSWKLKWDFTINNVFPFNKMKTAW